MKVSVIVPTYKPQAYLWECLESIYNQTFPKTEYELVLVLNGECLPYDERIKDWLSRHSDLQVQYLQTSEPGVSNARNMALNVAGGGYFLFIDDDDYVSPPYIFELYRAATRSIVSFSDAVSFDDETKQYDIENALHQVFISKSCRRLYRIFSVKRFYGAPVRKLISRDIIGDRRFDIHFKNGEDTLFFFLISDRIKYSRPAKASAIYYRRCRPSSAHFRQKMRKEKIRLGIDLMKTLCKYYFKAPMHYNFPFFITRLLGAFKIIIT